MSRLATGLVCVFAVPAVACVSDETPAPVLREHLEACIVGVWLKRESGWDGCPCMPGSAVDPPECEDPDCRADSVVAFRSDGAHLPTFVMFRTATTFSYWSRGAAPIEGRWALEGTSLRTSTSEDLAMGSLTEVSCHDDELMLGLYRLGIHDRADPGLEAAVFGAWETGDWDSQPYAE